MRSLIPIPRHLLVLILLALVLPASSHAQYAWRKIADLVYGRAYHSAVNLGGGRVLVIGGYTEPFTPTETCEIIDIVADRILPGPSMNTRRAELVALHDRDSNIIVIGGNTGAFNNGALTTSVERLDRATMTWRSIGSLLIARRQHVAAWISDTEILVVGGRHQSLGTMADAEIFDVTTGASRAVASFPFAINSAVMGISSAGEVLVLGGRDGGSNSYRENNVYRYDRAVDRWERIATIAEPIQRPELAKLWDGRLIISGGSKAEAPLDFSRDVQVETAGRWQMLAQMQVERQWSGLAQWTADTIMTLGGFDNTNTARRGTDWIDLRTGRSAPGPVMIGEHRYFATVAVPVAFSGGAPVRASIVAIAGGTLEGSITRMVEILELKCVTSVTASGGGAICSGDSLQLDVDAVGEYVWSPAEGLSCTDCRSPKASPATTSTYTVSVRDAATCSAVASVEVIVRPRPTVSMSGGGSVCAGESMRLSATGGGTYTWSPTEGLSCADCPDPIASPSRSTTYRLRVTSSEGCVTWDSVTVDVQPSLFDLTDIGETGRIVFDSVGLAFTRCRQVVLVNRTALPYTIASASLLGNLEFSIPPSQLPLVVGPNDTARLEICFVPSEVGERHDTLLVVAGCSRVVPLQGTGVSSAYVGDVCNTVLRVRSGELIPLAKLAPPAPNPATGRWIAVELRVEREGDARLEIFDAAGRRVALLLDRYLMPGEHRAQWDAASRASGVYYARLTVGDDVETAVIRLER